MSFVSPYEYLRSDCHIIVRKKHILIMNKDKKNVTTKMKIEKKKNLIFNR